MTDYRKKPFRLFPNVTVQVFVQFILIFLLIVSVILFSSSSFYMSMIESTYMLQMRQAADVLQTLDFNNPDTLPKIAKIEIEKNMLIEIYEKSDGSSDDFSHNIYSKYYYRDLNSVNFYNWRDIYSKNRVFLAYKQFIPLFCGRLTRIT